MPWKEKTIMDQKLEQLHMILNQKNISLLTMMAEHGHIIIEAKWENMDSKESPASKMRARHGI